MHGFTLIELLVTLAVAGVLITVAVPSFKTTFQDNRQVAGINELLGTLLFARSEAITENKSITVCASSDQESCGTNWGKGWIVYAPSGSTITPLRVHSALDSSNTLTTDSGLGSSFSFKGNGTTDSASGSFTLCDARGAGFARSINVSATGIVRASQTVGKALDGTTDLSCP